MEIFAILLINIAIIYFSIIILYSIGWFKTKTFQSKKNVVSSTKISVIIVARNEVENIAACLESLKRQTYSAKNFEVIVIDDHSEDDTFNIAEKIIAPIDNWKIEKLENLVSKAKNSSFKKQAITKGIELATGNLIVTLDADCVVPQNWLQTIAEFYEQHQPKMIVMPVRFEEGNASLQVFQQMDLTSLIGITAGSLYWNFPVMANGANLAYEKKVFQQVNGFEGNEQIPGGDDIMLLLKIKKQFPKSIKFLKNDSVIVTTRAVVTLQEFCNQRLRWISKSGKFGDWKITVVLVISYLFNLATILAFIIGCVASESLFLSATIVLFLKWCIEFSLVKSTATFLKQPFSLFNYLCCNVLHQLYVVVFGLLGTIVQYKWKGRKY
jgi:cellulose synthase/poly-beta-1,6-N-acetylglucosamine synthase-like glycosyltransferase